MSQGRKKKTKIQVKSPTQERSKQTVASILEACARIISREGYFAVTTDKIALEAGVSIGSLYQFFGNKESVVSALIRQLIDDDRKTFFAEMQNFVHLPAGERIQKMIEVGFQIFRQQPELRAALQSVRLYLTDQEYIQQSRRTFVEFVRASLANLSPGRDPEKVSYITVTAFLSMMNSALHDTPELVKDPMLMSELTLMFKKYLEIP